MAIGFSVQGNLSESNRLSTDSSALDNLYSSVFEGQTISNDIALFSNNLRATSTLIGTETANTLGIDSDYKVNNKTVIIRRSDRVQIAFANKTRVEHGSQSLIVFDSNGISSFKMKTLDDTVITPNSMLDIIRSDTVNILNIVNLSGKFPETQQNIDSPAKDIIIFSELFNEITKKIENFVIQRDESIIINEETVVDTPVTFNAVLNTIECNSANSGFFIDLGEDSVIRSFSSEFNIWDVSNSGIIECTEDLVYTQKLKTQTPNFITMQPIADSGNTFLDFTHKILIKNELGETLYLVAKLSA